MPERVDFWGLPQPWGPVLVYLILTLATLVMLARLYSIARFWRRGLPETRWDHPSRRLKRVAAQALLQIRTFSQRSPGWIHLLLSWTFLVFFLGTALATLNSHLLVFLRGRPYLLYKLALDLASLLFFVGAGMAFYRRLKLRPGRLTLSSRFLLSLSMLSWIVFDGLLIESLRFAIAQPSWSPWAPVGWLLSRLWLVTGLGENSLRALHLTFYTLHVASVSLFLVTLPVSNLLHLVSAPLNLFFASEMPSGARLEPVPVNGLGKRVYAWDASGLNWRQLLEADACTECGRCQDTCPAHAAGLPLSPKQIMLKIRSGSHSPGGLQCLPGGAIRQDELWACMACGACTQECPVFIDPLRAIVDFRRALIWEGRIDPRLQDAFRSVQAHGNTAGQPRAGRAAWAKGLPFRIKDARTEPVEYLWFVGDNASFDPDLARVTRCVAELFHAAGLDFGILYEAEESDGNDLRRAGEEGLFARQMRRNADLLRGCRFQAIVTTDPHAYNTIKNEYPPDALLGKPVLHYSELLEQLLVSGKLRIKTPLSASVTYHDPCYLGRINGVYDPPRRLLSAVGCSLSEMPHSRAHSTCCGAGGGRIWMDEGEVKQRPSERRIEEALALQGVTTFVVACPKDWIMYSDAAHERIVVKDLAELVAEAVL